MAYLFISMDEKSVRFGLFVTGCGKRGSLNSTSDKDSLWKMCVCGIKAVWKIYRHIH